MTTHTMRFAPSPEKVPGGKGREVEVIFEEGKLYFDGVEQPHSTLVFTVFNGTKQKLGDSFSGHITQAEFDSRLLKCLDKGLAGEWVMREVGPRKGSRAKLAADITKALLITKAQEQGMTLPKVSSPEYKALFTKFATMNAERIERDTAKRWAENESLDTSGLVLTLPGAESNESEPKA